MTGKLTFRSDGAILQRGEWEDERHVARSLQEFRPVVWNSPSWPLPSLVMEMTNPSFISTPSIGFPHFGHSNPFLL